MKGIDRVTDKYAVLHNITDTRGRSAGEWMSDVLIKRNSIKSVIIMGEAGAGKTALEVQAIEQSIVSAGKTRLSIFSKDGFPIIPKNGSSILVDRIELLYVAFDFRVHMARQRFEKSREGRPFPPYLWDNRQWNSVDRDLTRDLFVGLDNIYHLEARDRDPLQPRAVITEDQRRRILVSDPVVMGDFNKGKGTVRRLAAREENDVGFGAIVTDPGNKHHGLQVRTKLESLPIDEWYLELEERKTDPEEIKEIIEEMIDAELDSTNIVLRMGDYRAAPLIAARMGRKEVMIKSDQQIEKKINNLERAKQLKPDVVDLPESLLAKIKGRSLPEWIVEIMGTDDIYRYYQRRIAHMEYHLDDLGVNPFMRVVLLNPYDPNIVVFWNQDVLDQRYT